MTDTQQKSVLRRKAEAGRASATASRLVTPCKALSSALVNAVDSHVGLEATVGRCAMRTGTLAEVLETVPEEGLLAVLEGPEEAQGVLALDAALLSAVIEKLMTGVLAARPPAPRRATRTDAALVADAIDAMLSRFEMALAAGGTAPWAAGYGYASFLDSPRPLALMLDDTDYRLLSLEVDLESGARAGSMLLVLPARGAGGGGASSGQASSPAGASGEQPSDAPGAAAALPWAQALEDGVMGGRVRIRAELCRVAMPIAAVGTLVPGQSVPVPAEALDHADILGPDGRRIARGRLGQSRGMRAVRLHGPPDGVVPPASAPSGVPADESVALQHRPAPDPPDRPADQASAAGLPDLGDLPASLDGDTDDPLAGLPATIGPPDAAGDDESQAPQSRLELQGQT